MQGGIFLKELLFTCECDMTTASLDDANCHSLICSNKKGVF